MSPHPHHHLGRGDRPAAAQTAREGADSVFRYIARTAEPTADGVRWRTLDYENQPQYVSRLGGGAGICVFLADYFRLTRAARAREVAERGLAWCSAPGNEPDNNTLYGGWSGIGWAWLHLWRATGDPRALARAAAIGEYPVASSPRANRTEYASGSAGTTLFLLRLWQATSDRRFLAAALDRAAWIRDQALEGPVGCYWRWLAYDPSSHVSLGFAHGVAGIAYVLLAVREATGDPEWAAPAQGAATFLASVAVPDRGGLNWPRRAGEHPTMSCQWCHGAPGIGLFFAKAYEVLGDARYLRLARAAGTTTWAHGDVRANPSHCHGLAGNAELFLELHRLTAEDLWFRYAHEFAVQALGYRVMTADGEAWQADEPGMFSPDWVTGAAGVGHFFLRLHDAGCTPNPLRFTAFT